MYLIFLINVHLVCMHIATLQCTSENNSSLGTKVSGSAPFHGSSKYKYSVKVMDPSKKSHYDVTKLNNQGMFESVDEVKLALSQCVGSQVGDIGYINCSGTWNGGQKVCTAG